MKPADLVDRDQARRQSLANRKAARPLPDGRASFAQDKIYREHFVRDIVRLRAWLRRHR